MPTEEDAKEPEPTGESSDEQPKAQEPPPTRPATEAAPDLPPTKEEAITRLRSASDLANGRSEEIVSAGIGRLGGTGTVNIFQGDFSIEGDFHSAGGARRARARRAGTLRIEPDRLRDEVERYVPAADFDSSLQKLVDSNLVVFAGPAQTGRSARARVSLARTLERAGLPFEVFELTGPVLGNLAWRVPQRDCGLIVYDRPNAQGKFGAEIAINDAWLEHASKQLGDHNSFLVVVTGPVTGGELAAAANRGEFVVEDMELPDPMEIVRRRALNELPSMSADELRARLDETNLAELLDERDDPCFAAKAGKTITDALRSEGDLVAAVTRLGDPEDRVREWLGGEPDSADIALVLATAALEESSFLNIADAAISLYRKLNSSSTKLTPRFLRKLMAERSWIELAHRPETPGSPPVLRFRHAELAPLC